MTSVTKMALWKNSHVFRHLLIFCCLSKIWITVGKASCWLVWKLILKLYYFQTIWWGRAEKHDPFFVLAFDYLCWVVSSPTGVCFCFARSYGLTNFLRQSYIQKNKNSIWQSGIYGWISPLRGKELVHRPAEKP